jgi:hypothetical protein
VLIKNLAIFLPEFLPMSFKIQLLEISTQKQKEQKQKQLDDDRLVTTQDWKIDLMSLFF